MRAPAFDVGGIPRQISADPKGKRHRRCYGSAFALDVIILSRLGNMSITYYQFCSLCQLLGSLLFLFDQISEGNGRKLAIDALGYFCKLMLKGAAARSAAVALPAL